MTEEHGVQGAAPAPPEGGGLGEGSPPEPSAAEATQPPHGGRHRARGRYAQLRATADRTEHQVAAKAEDLRSRRASVRTAFLAYEHDRRHGGALLAGGLAYRFFIWLLPTALFLASVVSIVGDISSQSPAEVADHAGLGASLTVLIAKGAKETGKGSWVLIFLGLFLMVWAGMSVWKALRLVSSVAWQVRPTSSHRLLRASIVFCAVGIGLMVSPAVFTFLRSGPLITDIMASVLIASLLSAFAIWVMLSLPHPVGIRWTEFVPGAILFGVSIEVLRVVTSVYFVWRIGHTGLYGAFTVAAIFMAWLYLLGRIVVGALALTATRWQERHPLPPA